jgi:hypothetical protein
MLWRTGHGTLRARVAGAVRGTHLGSFAVIMATGIVSSALRAAGRPHVSAVLLAIAAAGFVVLAAGPANRGQPRDEYDDAPGDPACWLCRVCPACGAMADEDPPTICPQCRAPIPRV